MIDMFQTRKRDLVSKQIGMLVRYLTVVHGFTPLVLRRGCENSKINSKLMKTPPKYSGVVLLP